MAEKKTPLYDIHKQLGAKIIPFAGYLMPVMYDSINAEHIKVRETVGMFDITHMGEFEVSGPGAKEFVQKIVTNDISKLAQNQIMYTCMCREDGGIIDDLLVYNLKDKLILVVNASNIAKDFAHIRKYLTDDINLTDMSDQTALIAIQGPKSTEVVSRLSSHLIAELKYYHCDIVNITGESVLLSRTGYTGEDGFELYMANKSAEKVWQATYEIVTELGGGPIGLGARDSLRLEMKFALYGNDITEETNPIEAGLGWVVKLDKGDFVGRQAIVDIKSKGIRRKLIGFEVSGTVIPRQGYSIILNNNEIGKVTSGIFSSYLKKAVGTGYVPIDYSKPGTEIEIIIREKKHRAVIVKTPFHIGKKSKK